ncbi:hypothetical protein ACLOJK_004614, partial [Asimina triloba]
IDLRPDLLALDLNITSVVAARSISIDAVVWPTLPWTLALLGLPELERTLAMLPSEDVAVELHGFRTADFWANFLTAINHDRTVWRFIIVPRFADGHRYLLLRFFYDEIL